jgi:serine/tyrosine/threonine adenylyltransferase
VSGRKGPSHGL